MRRLRTWLSSSQSRAHHHSESRRDRVAAADIRAAVSSFGDPRNPAILFLHGIRLGREIWMQHASSLAQQYRVLTLDLPGHGALADVAFTEENVSAVLDAAFEQMLESPPLVVGYSLGGFVAMHYARRHPQRTRALLLAGCTLDFQGWRWWPYGVSVRLTETLPDAWLRAFVRVGLSLTLPRRWIHIVERIPFDRDVLTRTSEIVHSSVSALDTISTYRKPVLIVNGEYDLIFRLDERRFLHRLPQARLRIMRGMDHTGPLRRPAEFTSIVEGFAGKVFGSGTS
jgi:pimeloyl-ACP methyl ester carboxylesterase